MSSPSFDALASARYSTNMLARITKLDRRTIDKYLESEGIEKGADEKYGFLDSLSALISASKGQSSADRRNEAQARKAEVETDQLLRKNIPIPEVMPLVEAFLKYQNAQIERSELDDETKAEIIERARQCRDGVEAMLEDYKGGES